jgi:hypothetical protein
MLLISKTKIMKTSFIKIVAACLVTATLFTNCKKGDTGPAGADGTNGNANVKSQTSTHLNWTFNNATLAFETNISVPAITQDIVDRGAVLVYVQDGGTSSQMPFASQINLTDVVFFDFVYSVGNVKVMISNSDLDNSIVPQSTLRFKIVAMSASARAAHPNLNEYKDIQSVYHLAE